MARKKLFLFLLIVVLSVGILTFQSIHPKDSTPDLPVVPLRLIEKAAASVVRGVKHVLNSYFFLVHTVDENKELRRTILLMKQRENQMSETEKENERLKEILSLKAERPDYVAAAKVIARDPSNWFQQLWINKGSASGIEKNMAAVTPLGPVGRVHRVFESGANLILITDVNSSVAVRLQSSRTDGILEGRGDDRCILKYISKDLTVSPGDRVITSGLDGIFPEGILIGLVSDVKKEEREMFQNIEVIPTQNLNQVEEVAILKR